MLPRKKAPTRFPLRNGGNRPIAAAGNEQESDLPQEPGDAPPAEEASVAPHAEEAPVADKEAPVASEGLEFEILDGEALADLPDDFIASDDPANARRKGPMKYSDQERITALLNRGQPVVSADVAFPGHVSFGQSCIWVFEILLYDNTDSGEQVLRLVLPFTAKTESFENLKPILLVLRHRFTRFGTVFFSGLNAKWRLYMPSS